MKRTRPLAAEPAEPATRDPGFMEDLRAVLRPEQKWHYLFHAVVILVALSYWVGSLLKLPDASWAEIIMYRPKGDNQVYPIITALSGLNLGDPTDAFHYGKGVAGFHAVILLPHALAVAIFGWPGYMVADAFFFWAYFVVITMLMCRCQLGVLPSLIVGSALATGTLQSITNKASVALLKLAGTFEEPLSEWAFPNLVGLHIFDTRIPRPMITEIFVVLVLYFLLRAWRRSASLDAKMGVALGVCMGLLAQGDPYSFSTLGLVLGAVVIRNMVANRWRLPWRFAAGFGASALIVGAYFLFQLMFQHPDASVRFGLADHPRSRLLFLPGYGPLLRVGVVLLFGGIILMATRKKRLFSGQSDAGSLPGDKPSAAALDAGVSLNSSTLTRSTAQFCMAIVVAAWLAQPVQLFLLGKGAQIYHYLLFTLPTFYSYAIVLLMLQIAIHASPSVPSAVANKSAAPWAKRVLLSCLFAGEIILGIEPFLEGIRTPLTARAEVTPFSQAGPGYRAAFRALDKAFREEPVLKKAKTFATLSHEVNFLLTAFHNKRAFLPDNGFTTLSDRELEHRLFEVAKIIQLHPDDQFYTFVQNHIVLNFWLGCAKYWFASDHSYAPLSEYADSQIIDFKKMEAETPFCLALPPKENERLVAEYGGLFSDSEVATYPDVIIVTLMLKDEKIAPHPGLYAQVYENDVFTVFRKTVPDGAFSADPPAPSSSHAD